jgi:hypothetical protein
MKELFTSLLESVGLAWWIKIVTDNPECTYYFGPFLSQTEAEEARPGFIEDLESENAKIVSQDVMRTKPTEYTIYDERSDFLGARPRPIFSGQSS